MRLESLKLIREIIIDTLDKTALPQDDINEMSHIVTTMTEDQDMFKVSKTAVYSMTNTVRTMRRRNK